MTIYDDMFLAAAIHLRQKILDAYAGQEQFGPKSERVLVLIDNVVALYNSELYNGLVEKSRTIRIGNTYLN